MNAYLDTLEKCCDISLTTRIKNMTSMKEFLALPTPNGFFELLLYHSSFAYGILFSFRRAPSLKNSKAHKKLSE